MNITINDRIIECNAGELLIDVARRNGIDIPTLCYLKDVCHSSNCRICMCDINGRLVPACSAKVADNMVVYTNNDKVIKSRVKTLQLIMSTHHKDCDSCDKNHKCKLQELFEEYNIQPFKQDYIKNNYRIDTSSPCIIFKI